MLKSLLSAVCLNLIMFSASQAQTIASEDCLSQPQRGCLLESELIQTLSLEQMNQQFAFLGAQARAGVKIYRLVYQTQPVGKPLMPASSMVAIPDAPIPVLPWILIHHFTVLGDKEAPSVQPFIGLFEASQGFAAVVPDNLGFGTANDVYPNYLFAQGYAENGVDALRAAQAFSAKENLKFGPLFLSGYSEGGYATLALQQSLETTYAGEFPLLASAPVAGPYDVNTFRAGLAQPQISSLYLNNLLLSYETWLTPKLDLEKIFALDLTSVRELYNGNKIADEIRPSLPVDTKAVFKASFVDDLALESPVSEEARGFIQLLNENSFPRGDWTPKTPTRFFHCADDDVVPVGVTQITVARFLAINAQAPISSEILASPSAEQVYRHGSCPLFYSYISFFAGILQAQSSAR